jgi:hypothetical protein
MLLMMYNGREINLRFDEAGKLCISKTKKG